MQGDRVLSDAPKFELPPDLVAELQRRGTAPKVDMNVEHWKPSLLGRLLAMFSGKSSR